MNPMNLLKLKPLGAQLANAHPEVIEFGKSLYPDMLTEGSTIAIYAATPDGQMRDVTFSLSQDDIVAVRKVIDIFAN